MRQKVLMPRPPFASPLRRTLPAGAGFVIAGLGSVMFWGLIAGIAAIV